MHTILYCIVLYAYCIFHCMHNVLYFIVLYAYCIVLYPYCRQGLAFDNNRSWCSLFQFPISPAAPPEMPVEGPPPPPPSMAAINPEKRREVQEVQQKLVLLLHAHKCQRKDQTNGAISFICQVTGCSSMKTLLKHMTECQEGKSCKGQSSIGVLPAAVSCLLWLEICNLEIGGGYAICIIGLGGMDAPRDCLLWVEVDRDRLWWVERLETAYGG